MFKRALLALALSTALISQAIGASGFYVWSTTANNNASIDSTINWALGMSPSSVSPSARAMMARLAEFRNDINGTLLTTGTSTAYVLATNQNYGSSPTAGMVAAFKLHVTNGAASTIAVDSLGAKPLRITPGVALGAGALQATVPYLASYQTSNGGEWIVFNNIPVTFSGGTVPAPDGSCAAPGFSYASDPSTGFYRVGAGHMRLCLSGAQAIDFAAATTTFSSAFSFTGALTASGGGTFGGTFTGSHTYSGAVTLSGGGTLTGTFGGNPTFSGTPAFSGTPTFSNAITAPNTPKAMVYFTVSGVTPTVRKSYNVTGVVRNSAGNYTVTITSAMADALFYVAATGSRSGTTCAITDDSRTTTTVVATSYNTTGSSVDCDHYSILVFGD